MTGNVQFAILPKVLGLYRSHAANISHTQKDAQSAAAQKIQRQALERFLSIKFSETEKLVFETLLLGKIHERISVADIENYIEKIAAIMSLRNYNADEIYFALGERFKNLFHYAKSKTHLKDLFKSKLNSRFGMPLPWRIFYFCKNSMN